jgi:Fe-S-cluster containining protein
LGLPGDAEDLDTARWYLLHEGASVFIDREGAWWVRIENRCLMLQDTPRGLRCKDYRNRPLVCRRFSPKTCDFTRGRWHYARLFRTPQELDEYVRGLRGRPLKAKARPRR